MLFRDGISLDEFVACAIAPLISIGRKKLAIRELGRFAVGLLRSNMMVPLRVVMADAEEEKA